MSASLIICKFRPKNIVFGYESGRRFGVSFDPIWLRVVNEAAVFTVTRVVNKNWITGEKIRKQIVCVTSACPAAFTTSKQVFFNPSLHFCFVYVV